MNIQINPDDVKALVSEAILKTLDDEKRATLIKDAIAHLLTPPTGGGYGYDKTTPLQSAFRVAVEHTARRLCLEMLEQDEGLKGQIRALLTEAMEKAMTTQREKVVNDMAENFASWLTRDR